MGAQNQESLRWETPHSELLHSSLKNGEPLPCIKQYVALWKTVALPLCCAQKMSPGDKQPLVPVEKQLLLCSDPCPQHAAPTASTAHNPSPTRPSIMLSPLHTARGSKPWYLSHGLSPHSGVACSREKTVTSLSVSAALEHAWTDVRSLLPGT